MTTAEIVTSVIGALALLVAFALPTLFARDAEAKVKGKQEAIEEASKKTFDAIAKTVEAFEIRIKQLEISTAVDRSALGNVSMSIAGLRGEMDRRFDQLERLIAKAKHDDD